MSTGIKLILKIFFVDVTLGLSFAHESNNFEHQAIVNLTRCKFDGVEVNNHVAIFGSELHCGESFDSYRIHDFDDHTTGSVQLGQLSHPFLKFTFLPNIFVPT